MSDNVQRLSGFQEAASRAYTTDIVHPFRELAEEIRDTSKMVLSYRVAKQDYDYAHAAVIQLENSASGAQGGPRLEAAQKKLQAASDKYEQTKSEIRDRCAKIDSLKNYEVQSHVAHYMESQLQFFEQCHSFLKDRISDGNRSANPYAAEDSESNGSAAAAVGAAGVQPNLLLISKQDSVANTGLGDADGPTLKTDG